MTGIVPRAHPGKNNKELSHASTGEENKDIQCEREAHAQA